MQWSDIKDWKASTLSGQYDGLSSKENNADEWGRRIVALNEGLSWEGQARAAADSRLKEIENGVSAYIVGVRAMKTATSAMQDAMREVEALVNDAQMRATNNGFSIADDGTVTDENPISWLQVGGANIVTNAATSAVSALIPGALIPGALVGKAVIDNALAVREAALKECAAKVNEAVERAVKADQAYADALNEVGLGNVKPQTNLTGVIDGPLPQPQDRNDSRANAEWWDSLTPEQQQELINNDYQKPASERIGNLDGVNGSARDQANRISIGKDIERYKEMEASGTLTEEDRKNYEELKDLNEAIHPKDPNAAQRQLLLYDPVEPGEDQDQLHAAVGVGNVDTAKNIGVQTGGLDTSVGGNIDEYVKDMENIRNTTNGDTAMVTYFGYDPPHLFKGDNTDLSVTDTERAAAGGGNLANFLEGLHDSRQGAGEAGDPRITAIGHSYGSTTTGYALTQVRDGVVDSAVLYGSPGVPATNVSDFNVPSDAVYAMRNPADMITAMPNANEMPDNRPFPFPTGHMTETTDPMGMPDIQQLRPNQYAPTNPFRADKAHTDYFMKDPGSIPDSQKDVAAVIDGTYQPPE